MAIKVFITIDTEEDNWGDYPTQGSVDNISKLPMLQDVFNKYGAIPTYLINYPVATTTSSIKTLSGFLEKNQCEIGTHCHPWNTPPFTEKICTENTMMCNLPADLLMEKMKNLHAAIESNFGVTPTSFRAGRWGFDEKVAKCIAELGYKIDTSISPFVDWSAYCGPNFREGHTHSYLFNSNDIMTPVNNGELIEVPPTIGFFQSNFQFSDSLQNQLKKPAINKFRLLGILDKLQLLNFRWLCPELSTGAEMVRLSKRFISSGHEFLNMSFHSTNMLPGKSPFVRNHADRTKFLDEIEMFLKYAVENGFEFLPLSESVNCMNHGKVNTPYSKIA